MASGNIDQHDPLAALSALSSAFSDATEEEGATMSLLDHLEELRWRIFKSLIAIAIFSVIAFIFRDTIMHFLAAPLPKEANALGQGQGGKLVVTGLMEGFTVFLLISIAAGIVLSLPVILYQTWAFIAPGLY